MLPNDPTPDLPQLTDEQRNDLKEAIEKCSETVNRAMFSLLAVSMFCLLTTLGASDRALVAPDASITIPFADAPMSFIGFLVVAPLLLSVMLVYLHIFYGVWRTLDRQRRAHGLATTYPVLCGLDHWIARSLTAFILEGLVLAVLFALVWKASVRITWAVPLYIFSIIVLICLTILKYARERLERPLPRRWRFRVACYVFALLLGVACLLLISIGIGRDYIRHLKLSREPVTTIQFRSLDLFRVDLKGARLVGIDMRNADLRYANLEGAEIWANLNNADLSWANLRHANLRRAGFVGARLMRARLEKADLREGWLRAADLSGADLSGADLSGANLDEAILNFADFRDANLSGASLEKSVGMTCDQIRSARTDARTKLPTELGHCRQGRP